MTFLFIHTIGKSKFGGGERWVVSAAAGLMKKGHQVTVIGLPESTLLKAAKQANVPTKKMNIRSDISPWHILKIKRYLSKNHTDVIITRVTDLFVAGIAVKLLSKKAKRPRVFVRHGLPLRYNVRKHLMLHKKLANGIITNANSIRENYISKGYFSPDFITVVHNGTEFCEKVIPYDFDKQFPGKKIVLSAGRLAKQKGYKHLIDAISLLPAKYNDLVFIILGTGKLLNSLKRHAENKNVAHRVHFYGFKDNIRPFLAGCDLFVLPSLYEGMPNAAMEAMAIGKPVILTRVDGTPELVPDEGKGMLVPPANPKALAEAITTLMDNSHRRQQMGNNAALHIARNFSTERMIDGVEFFCHPERN